MDIKVKVLGLDVDPASLIGKTFSVIGFESGLNTCLFLSTKTPRQNIAHRIDLGKYDKAVKEYIQKYCFEYGYTPTIREVCTGVGITSTSVAAYVVAKLTKDAMDESAKRAGK